MEVRLKEVARDKGISLGRLGRETAIPESLMSKYANGHVLPRVDRAIRISNLLGVCPSEIWVLKQVA